jgi:hypothetical protein
MHQCRSHLIISQPQQLRMSSDWPAVTAVRGSVSGDSVRQYGAESGVYKSSLVSASSTRFFCLPLSCMSTIVQTRPTQTTDGLTQSSSGRSTPRPRRHRHKPKPVDEGSAPVTTAAPPPSTTERGRGRGGGGRGRGRGRPHGDQRRTCF